MKKKRRKNKNSKPNSTNSMILAGIAFALLMYISLITDYKILEFISVIPFAYIIIEFFAHVYDE